MKGIRFLLILFTALVLPSLCQAAPGYLNNNQVLMLPLRQTFETLGYAVHWFDGSIQLARGENTVIFQYNRESYLHQEQVKPFTVLPRMMNGTIYVSQCFVEEVASFTQEEKEMDGDQFKLVFKNDDSANYPGSLHTLQGELFHPYTYANHGVQRVPVLMYHMVDDPARYRGLGHYIRYLVHPDQFRAQLRWLRENGYNTVTLQDLYAHRQKGKPLPENPVILTFDDGYACAYQHALPELVRYDMVGTFFVCSENMDGKRYLSAEMLVKMHKKGMEVGSHSMTHANLVKISLEHAATEIAQSKADLEALTGGEVQFFSYPYGAFNPAVQQLVEKSGYLGAVTTSMGYAAMQEDMMKMKRVFIGYFDELEQFAGKVGAAAH